MCFGKIRRIQGGLKLGESPVWDVLTNRLLYVDIEDCMAVSVDENGLTPMTQTTSGMVGCVVPMKNGCVLAMAGHSLVEIDFLHQKQVSHATVSLPSFIRFNDGKCDVYGNLWVGTMAIDQGHPSAQGGGSLLCIRNGKIIAEYKGFSIPNGMAWSGDNRTFYHIDTAMQRVDAYTVCAEGVLTEKRTLLAIPPEEGAPDGMCADVQGNLWIALWGGGRVVCYNPHTGQKLQEIFVPDRNVSCCTFGGVALQTLYITTACAEDGRKGGLFSVETSTKGIEPFIYRVAKKEE